MESNSGKLGMIPPHRSIFHPQENEVISTEEKLRREKILLSRKIGVISQYIVNPAVEAQKAYSKFAVETIEEFVSQYPDRKDYSYGLNLMQEQYYDLRNK